LSALLGGVSINEKKKKKKKKKKKFKLNDGEQKQLVDNIF